MGFIYKLQYFSQGPAPSSGVSKSHYWLLQDMGKVPVAYIFIAIVPAVMIAGLYFFDHSVAAQMAQQKEYNLKNPSAYHYDLFLLGFMVKASGNFALFYLEVLVYCMELGSNVSSNIT